MAISTLDNVYNSPQSASPDRTLGKDDFLKLFTMQLRYQDPLNPLNNSEFTSQLAQFSSLEQLDNINTQLKDLLLYQNSLQNTLTSDLIGRKVRISGNEVYLKGNAEIGYTLPKDVSKVQISVYNSSGDLVKAVEMGQQTSGEQSYVWDGTDGNGNPLPEGQYTFHVEALDASGNPVDVSTTVYGTVTGITFDNNTTYLIVDERLRIQLSDIKEIKGGA